MSLAVEPINSNFNWSKAKINHWKTGKPIENDWYLTETISKDTPYEVLKFENGKWFDYLDGVFEEVRDSYVKNWKKIED